MAEKALGKVGGPKFIAFDPLNAEQRPQILENILSTGGVTSEKSFISINADRDSI